MKRLILALLMLVVLVSSCGISRYKCPQKEETVVHYIDSIRWHDSTIVSYLTKERYVDVVNPMDTLNLETFYAKAQAYLDTTTKALKGSIENKSDVPIKTQIKWKEKIVYRDSIVKQEVPVEVVKEIVKYPKSYWWFMGISILALIYAGLKVYFKFKK